MKKFLKALGVAALAAAVIPCKVEKDEETGVKTFQSLLSRLRVGPGEGGVGTGIWLDALGGILPSALGHTEDEDYADGDVDGLVSEPIFEMKLEREVPAGDTAQAAADEAQAIADEAQAAADEAQAIADEAEKHGIDL